MVKEASRSTDKDSDALSKTSFLFLRILTAHDCRTNHVCEHLEAQTLQLDVNLCTKLTSWTENDAISTVVASNLLDFKRMDR